MLERSYFTSAKNEVSTAVRGLLARSVDHACPGLSAGSGLWDTVLRDVREKQVMKMKYCLN